MSEGVGSVAAAAFEPFWHSLREKKLNFPKCEDCERFHWYPKSKCPFCGSSKVKWRQLAGEGVLFSWTTVRHAFSDEYREKIPYVVALVEFDDAPGVRLVSNLTTPNLYAIRIGMRLAPDFSHVDDEPPRVVFAPVQQ